jgi:N utilization substance protein B
MGIRRKAREYALQMLFQWDMTHDLFERIAPAFWENNKEPATVMDFANQLVTGTIEHVEEIDKVIQQNAANWRLDRMEVVDRNVLRLAVQEFLYDKETPKNVVINEAIEIAKRYSGKESPPFINGILDSIRKGLD